MNADERACRLVALFEKHGLVRDLTTLDRVKVEHATARAIQAAVADERKAIKRLIEERSEA